MSSSSAVSRGNDKHTNMKLRTGSTLATRQPNAIDSDGIAMSRSVLVAAGTDAESFNEVSPITVNGLKTQLPQDHFLPKNITKVK